ncbi:MAG: hypothetical protein MK135_03205 [Polyangiaceae bacterium]|nr:hypothetical protein [Polyangiaceae bacterium]
MKKNLITSSGALIAGALIGCSATQPPTTATTTDAPKKEEEALPLAPQEHRATAAENFKTIEAHGQFVAPLPTAVTSFGIASHGPAVYVLGGYHGVPHAYSREGQSQTVWKLDTSKEEPWEKVGELTTGLQGLAAVALDSQICQVGGVHAHNQAGEKMDMRSVSTFRCLELETGTWHERPDLPQARSSIDAASYDGKVYVAGGWSLNGTPGAAKWAESVLVFDSHESQPQWQEIPTPFQVRAAGVVATASHLVVAGGMTSEGRPTGAVHILDLASQEWSTGPDFPGDAFGLALAAQGDSVIASGRDGMIRRWSVGQEKWQEIRPLAFGRFFHQLAVVEDKVLAVGGIGGMHTRGRTKPVELLPLTSKGTTFGELVVENPSDAKNRQGFIWRGEEAYVFGGNNSLGQHDFAAENFEKAGFIYDFATLKFRRGPDYPAKRQSMVTGSTKSGGIALGGFGMSADPALTQAMTQTDVMAYDWDDEKWERQSELPLGRTQFGLVQTEDEDWILGGLNYNPAKPGMKAFDHRLDILNAPGQLETPFKGSGLNLPGPRRAYAATLYDGKYYIVGGMKEGFALVENCLTFDIAEKKFADLPCPNESRLSGELIALNDKLYLIGGSVRTENGMEENRKIAVFDPSSKTWSELDFEIPMSVRHLRAFRFGSQIALFSTHRDDGKLSFSILNPGESI